MKDVIYINVYTNIIAYNVHIGIIIDLKDIWRILLRNIEMLGCELQTAGWLTGSRIILDGPREGGEEQL